MFGYVKPDNPYLYMKDDTLYKALYCGVCKSIGKTCGQCARFSLTYDIAFMSAVIHNLLGEDVKIERKHCVIHWITKRPIAQNDKITEALACLNVILAYYKVLDDLNDNGRGRGFKLFLSKGYKRACKNYPALDKIVKDNYFELANLEKSGEKSIDKICDPFAKMLQQLSEQLLGETASESSSNFFYNLGKWIYLIDALDDYDKDVKKGNYNPFYSAYGASDYSKLRQEKGEEISFIMSSVLFGIEDNLKGLKFRFNADLIRNIAQRGTMQKTKAVLSKDNGGKESKQ